MDGITAGRAEHQPGISAAALAVLPGNRADNKQQGKRAHLLLSVGSMLNMHSLSL
jgi:hypothetical protein